MSTTKSSSKQHRQIRAVYDENTITVYQAYNTSIATAAVAQQCLSASPLFRLGRRTWIKPSWNWMMYRSGYSYKDENQSNILALRLKREVFEKLLMESVESDDRENLKSDGTQVRVQWDPERDVRIQKLNADGKIRSIQIGIGGVWKEYWLRNGIVCIEDVTEKARELKRVLDEEPNVTEEELLSRGLIPQEIVYNLPEKVAEVVRCT